MDPYDVHIMMESRGYNPLLLLEQWKALYGASGGSVTQVYEGNIEDLLSLHLGDEDIPLGSTKPLKKTDETPFSLNLDRFLRAIDAGRPVFQWVLTGCTRDPSQDD
jgi:hypothetical protein